MDKKPVTNIDVSYNVAMITLGNLPDDINLISKYLKFCQMRALILIWLVSRRL